MRLNFPYYRFIFLPGLFLLCAFLAHAQNWQEHLKEDIEDKHFINASFGYQYSNLSVKSNFAWENLYKDIKFYERGAGLYGHLQFGVVLNSKLDLLVGLSYNQRQIIQTSDFNFVDCATTTWGDDVTLDAHRIIDINNFGIPLEIRMKIGTDRIMIYPGIGVTADFGMRKYQDVDIFLENGTICHHPLNDSPLTHNKDINIALLGKFGMRVKIVKKIYFKSELYYKMYGGKESVLTDFNNTNLFSYGLMGGFEYFL